MIDIPLALLPFTRKAFPCDVLALKDNLRPDDTRDIMSICGHSPEDALWLGLKRSSPCVTFFMPGNPDTPVGMGGVVLPGIVWALFHKDFLRTKREREVFLKACPMVLEWFIHKSSVGFIHNMTLCGNKRIRRWLKWLGAKEIYSTGAQIIHFYFMKEDSQHV